MYEMEGPRRASSRSGADFSATITRLSHCHAHVDSQSPGHRVHRGGYLAALAC